MPEDLSPFFLFFVSCCFFPHYFIGLTKGISSSYRLPRCHSGLVAFQSPLILSLFKPVGPWKVQMDDLKNHRLHYSTFFLSDPSPSTAPSL